MKCLNPKIIYPNSWNSKDILPRERGLVERVPGFQGFLVPCYKCSECFKSRQSDFACRIAREAATLGSMIFVTFTYRDDALPFSCRLLEVDEDTGECVVNQPYHIISDDSLLSELRDTFKHIRPSRVSRSIVTETPFPCLSQSCGLKYMYEFTPSLDRTGVRLWLKRERVRYERAHGCKLPKFKYALIGEYGPNTVRPHFHACFMGLKYEHVSEMLASWKEDFGNVWIESVKRINLDGSSGFLAASRYLGKYITKGVVEADSVKLGMCEKPRICASLNLGTELTREQIDYYSAYDLYGRYDPERLCLLDGTPLSNHQISIIQLTVFRRGTITVDGHSFVLPKSIISKIWKYEEKKIDILNGKVKRSLKSYKIRVLAAMSSSVHFLQDLDREYEQYCSLLPEGASVAQRASFWSNREAGIQNKIQIGMQNFVQGYSGAFL